MAARLRSRAAGSMRRSFAAGSKGMMPSGSPTTPTHPSRSAMKRGKPGSSLQAIWSGRAPRPSGSLRAGRSHSLHYCARSILRFHRSARSGCRCRRGRWQQACARSIGVCVERSRRRRPSNRGERRPHGSSSWPRRMAAYWPSPMQISDDISHASLPLAGGYRNRAEAGSRTGAHGRSSSAIDQRSHRQGPGLATVATLHVRYRRYANTEVVWRRSQRGARSQPTGGTVMKHPATRHDARDIRTGTVESETVDRYRLRIFTD